MYTMSYLDTLDSNEYNEFLFWSGQISKKSLDPDPTSVIMDPMKEMNDIEIQGDLQDEYLANQEAENSEEGEESFGQEVSQLLIELWDEDRKRDLETDLEYTEEEAFRDFIMDQKEDFDG